MEFLPQLSVLSLEGFQLLSEGVLVGLLVLVEVLERGEAAFGFGMIIVRVVEIPLPVCESVELNL